MTGKRAELLGFHSPTINTLLASDDGDDYHDYDNENNFHDIKNENDSTIAILYQ